MSGVIDSLERAQLRQVPVFQSGDRLKVHFQVVEGTRRRTQVFEGTVIKRQGEGARETFTVRKQSFGVGVERTFPVHSPKIERIEVASRGDVRRAKLYYLRGRVGRRARVRERQYTGADAAAGVMPAPEEAEDSAAAAEVLPGTEVEHETDAAVVADAAGAPDGDAVEAPASETAADEGATPEPEASEGEAAPAAGDDSAESAPPATADEPAESAVPATADKPEPSGDEPSAGADKPGPPGS